MAIILSNNFLQQSKHYNKTMRTLKQKMPMNNNTFVTNTPPILSQGGNESNANKLICNDKQHYKKKERK
jgi:hypothetical protein